MVTGTARLHGPSNEPFWLGGAGLGNSIAPMSDAAAHETIAAAWEVGVRTFDTAPHYGLGLSERRFGAALKMYPRDSFRVSTKVGRVLEPGPGDGWDDGGFVVPNHAVRRYDVSRDGILRSLEESLGRLQLDRVDILFLHDPDQSDDPNAIALALPIMADLRDQGVVGAIGIGSGSVAAHEAALQSGLVNVAMLSGRYTLLDQSGADFLAKCDFSGVPVVGASVFNSGILSSDFIPTNPHYDYRPASVATVERVRRMSSLCHSYGLSLPAVAFAYARRPRSVMAIALGAQSRAHVLENDRRARVAVPESFWNALDDLLLARAGTGDRPQ